MNSLRSAKVQPLNDFVEDTITLRNKEIIVQSGYLPQADLRFFPENPRIYSVVWNEDGEEPTQEQIFAALSKAEHVREILVPSIRSNGGLIEPVLVRGKVVLEGNSRLAAYRLLAQGADASKWGMIKVRVLPSGISDSEAFSLLGEYHIVGKKDWAPFEQAGYLYRRFKSHHVTDEQLRQEVGLAKAKIQHLIHVYGFMLERNDRNPARWSFYDELLKGRRFDATRQLFPNFDQIVADKIASEEIPRAVDVRDGLPLITRVGGKTLRKFVDGKFSFEEAVDDARARGAGNYSIKKLSDFRKWLAEENIAGEARDGTIEEAKQIEFELKKISARVSQLLKKLT
jgi:hypothetical protein